LYAGNFFYTTGHETDTGLTSKSIDDTVYCFHKKKGDNYSTTSSQAALFIEGC
jgi:hypothetical protein